MNTTLSEAAKEAYAISPTGELPLETLELSHPSLVGVIRLVKDRAGHTFGVDGSDELFEPCGFRMSLPQAGESGLQELSIAIDNVDLRITDFINAVKESATAVTVKYRLYLISDPSTAQNDPPLELSLTDVNLNDIEVTGKATFADVLNKGFLSLLYTRDRFPGIGNG
jgi:hypothetical protein